MKENRTTNRSASFLNTSEGKKILFFSFLLIFVVGMMLYSYYTQQSTSWTDLLQNTSFEEQEVVGSKPYNEVLLDLRNMDPAAFDRKRQEDEDLSPNPSELRTGLSDARGRILSFSGTLTRRPIPIEPIPDRSITIHELKIQNQEKDLTYLVHLLFPTETTLKKGTSISGEGVYLTTRSNAIRTPSKNSERPSPEILLMARQIQIQSKPDAVRSHQPEQSQEAEQISTDSPADSSDIEPSPPSSYSDRKTVTNYWNTLLSPLGRDRKINPETNRFKRMVSELESVIEEDLNSWVDSSVTPSVLKEEPAEQHRGNVISFQGKYIQRYKKELLGGPQERDFVWEYWIRDQKHHVTYTFYSFRKANFDPNRGTPVEGHGVFLNKQVYDLLNPRRAGDRIVKKGQTMVLLGFELNPHFTPTASSDDSTVQWVQYVLGGLVVLSLGIFFVMVYISLSGDVEKRAENLRNVRNRKPSPQHTDDLSPNDDPASDE